MKSFALILVMTIAASGAQASGAPMRAVWVAADGTAWAA